MWMLNTVRLQQILTRKHLKNISGGKNGHSATLPGTQTHGMVTLWFCSNHFFWSGVSAPGVLSVIQKSPHVPGLVIQHDYWNYTVTLIALIAQQLIKHAGFQTQKDKIGDLPPSFLLTPAGCLWWKILLHLRRVLPIFFRLWAIIKCICWPYEENIWIQAFCLLY